MAAPSLRTCVGCRARRERGALVRLTTGAGGLVMVARPGAAGRGAYLCPALDCLAKALAGKSIPRALRRAGVRVDPDGLALAFGREIRRRCPGEPGEGA